nr:SDR family oxidoreductase [Candidatus Sigynarchaeota archaeon]
MKSHDAFSGKFAAITGGSSGMGKAIAMQLAQRGSSVTIMARNEERLALAKHEIEPLLVGKAFVETLKVDATDEAQVKTAFTDMVSRHGVPDFLFNCVGAAEPGYIQDFTISQYEKAMKQDYFAYVIPAMQLLPRFIEKKAGYIVNIASIAGFLGLIGYGTYTPAKFAVVGFSEVLRHELKPRGINVSVVCPPDTDTPGFHEENKTKPEECKILSQRGKLIQPAQVAAKILEGVEKKRFLILPGDARFIFTMKRLFPGLVYKTIDDDLKKALKQLGK